MYQSVETERSCNVPTWLQTFSEICNSNAGETQWYEVENSATIKWAWNLLGPHYPDISQVPDKGGTEPWANTVMRAYSKNLPTSSTLYLFLKLFSLTNAGRLVSDMRSLCKILFRGLKFPRCWSRPVHVRKFQDQYISCLFFWCKQSTLSRHPGPRKSETLARGSAWKFKHMTCNVHDNLIATWYKWHGYYARANLMKQCHNVMTGGFSTREISMHIGCTCSRCSHLPR